MATHRAEVRHSRKQSRERIVAAAEELVRNTSYGELSVDEVMREAGMGRTIFYRHFDDLADLLMRAGREAIEELYAAQVALAESRAGHDPGKVREAMELPVRVYRRHGPLLRAISEALASDQLVAADQEFIRRRFDQLVAGVLHDAPGAAELANAEETARALNLLNESYLLDAFGREPRVSVETAATTLTAIWAPLLSPGEGS